MQRTKVFGVAAALVSAAIAAVLLTGGASASAWHTYKGDMFAGHAYGLTVPDGSENIEFIFDGAEAGSASIGVYAPGGDKAGFYKLAPGLPKASVANPDSGRYVVYVYDITEGALSVRVASEDEPTKLELESIELAREETKVGSFEMGKIDETITVELDRETVFLTLLYEGSSKDLDATVSSDKGKVVTILDETATAFEPGVWTSLKGERVFDAANLDGTKYTVEIHAAQFEGTMVLTTLRLETPMTTPIPGIAPMPTPAPAPGPHSHGSHAHKVKEVAPISTASAQFALEEGIPVAFEVTTATALVLADPAALDEDEDGDRSYEGDDCVPLHGVVTIYAPDDSVLGVFELSHDEPTATIELPTKGEYVAYARHVEGDPIMAQFEGQAGAPTIRTLAVEEEILGFQVESFLANEQYENSIELANVPVDLVLRLQDGLGAMSYVDLSNEKGSVASVNSPASVGGAGIFDGRYVDPANFAVGAHTLTIGGIYQGNVELVYTYYVRASDVSMDAAAKLHDEHTHEPAEPEEPEEPSTPVTPPVPPPPFVSGIVDALGL